MARFPPPLALPGNVTQSRKERAKQLLRSSVQGLLIRSSIILFELFGVLLFGSSALMMDALSSLIDVASTLLLIVCIKLAERPPDEDHPFGHGRYEPLIGLQLGLLMVLIGGGMLFLQIFNLYATPAGKLISPYAWIIPFFAMILLEICYQMLMRTAKNQNSPALAADAVHYRLDGLTSLFASVALIFAAFFPQWGSHIDYLGALVIACLMVVVGIKASLNNLNQIMDRIPDVKYFNLVRLAALRVGGVFGTEKIRIQIYGPDAHVDIDIEVDPHLSVELAHAISQKVRNEIQKDWPAVRDVTVHIEPYYPNDH